MTMDRRDFLKAAAAAGLAVVAPFATRKLRAEPYTGTFWILVNASGGWDPTGFCDPKGAQSADEQNPMNRNYLAADIRTAGGGSSPIRYAPIGGNEAFFEKYYQRLLVINGVDTATNGHDSGSRFTWSGKLIEGFPSFGALVASAAARDKPMSFISNGGYDVTSGLVAPTRSSNPSVYTRIAYPNRVDPNNAESLYHSQLTMERILATRAARQTALAGAQNLPRYKNAINTLYTANLGQNDVARLTEYLPNPLDNTQNPLRRQAQLALAAYKAGLSVSANLNIGGFDTHGNHDDTHTPRVQAMLEGVDFIMTEAERQGVADKVVVVMGSDFGRTPRYNSTNGKDHWSITSMMMMGPGIVGNRVIGATDGDHRPLTVNPTTLQQDPNGVRVTPEHVHLALRKLAGVQESEAAKAFPLGGQELPLLG
ncbi:MAG: DUF1501 domain-containing protein [Myxococcota bacterium]